MSQVHPEGETKPSAKAAAAAAPAWTTTSDHKDGSEGIGPKQSKVSNEPQVGRSRTGVTGVQMSDGAKYFLRLRTLDGETAGHKFGLPSNLFVMLLHYWIGFVATEKDWNIKVRENKGTSLSCSSWSLYVVAWFGLPTLALVLVTSLQIYFLRTIYWVKESEGTCYGEEKTCELWGSIGMCAIAAFTLSIWPEFVESGRMIMWLWFSDGKVGPGVRLRGEAKKSDLQSLRKALQEGSETEKKGKKGFYVTDVNSWAAKEELDAGDRLVSIDGSGSRISELKAAFETLKLDDQDDRRISLEFRRDRCLTPWMRGYCYLYSWAKLIYEVFFLHFGVKFLLLSDKNEDVILNTAALAFIAELDELAFRALASDVIAKDIEENMDITVDSLDEDEDIEGKDADKDHKDKDNSHAWSFLFFNFALRGLKLGVVVAIMLIYTHLDVLGVNFQNE